MVSTPLVIVNDMSHLLSLLDDHKTVPRDLRALISLQMPRVANQKIWSKLWGEGNFCKKRLLSVNDISLNSSFTIHPSWSSDQDSEYTWERLVNRRK